MTWFCQSVRITAIWSDPRPAPAEPSWQAVVGSPPERAESQPRFGTSSEFGPIWDASTSLERRATPGRIDWMFAPVFPQQFAFTLVKWPNIGELEPALQSAVKLVMPHLVQHYDATRFAIGVVALQPSSDKQSSYRQIEQLLPRLNLDLEGGSDFLYQINRPRPSSAIRGLTINRIAKWSTMSITGMEFMVAVGQPMGVVHSAGEPLYAAGVEVDVNSAPEHGRDAVRPHQREPLLKELATQALELVHGGDVR